MARGLDEGGMSEPGRFTAVTDLSEIGRRGGRCLAGVKWAANLEPREGGGALKEGVVEGGVERECSE